MLIQRNNRAYLQPGHAYCRKNLVEEERKSALSRAIREAITYCLEQDILAEYLKRHSGEAINMFTIEFDINVAEQVWKEEAHEKGRSEGQREILELMNRVETMEDFMRLRERLKTTGSTRSV